MRKNVSVLSILRARCSVVVTVDVLMNCILLPSNFLKPYSLYIDKLIIKLLTPIFFITLLRTDIPVGNYALQCSQQISQLSAST